MEWRNLPLALLIPSIGNAAEWTELSSSDPFTDEVRLSALTSIERASIVVRCADGLLETYIDMGDYLGDGLLDVRFRFDSDEAVREEWLPSSKGTAVFARDDLDFARRLLRSDRFAFEVNDYRGVAHQAVGDLPSDGSVLREVMTACGIAAVSVSDVDPTIPTNISSSIERWGPTNVLINKQILQVLGKYDGPINSEKDIELHRAATAILDEYMQRCVSDRKFDGIHCFSLRLNRADASPPPVSSVIYELAPEGELKSAAGASRIGD